MDAPRLDLIGVSQIIRAKMCAVYVDDSCLQRETYQACLDNISDTIKLLRELGSVIQTEKSVLTPSQTIAFLGFNISSKI